MHPAMILAAAAGGAMVWDWWRNRATNNASDEEARKKAMQSAVTSFEAGDSYSVQMMALGSFAMGSLNTIAIPSHGGTMSM